MSIHQSIAQVFENNMGNRITPELAGGMIRSLVDILASGIQQAEVAAEPLPHEQEGNNGMV